MFRSRKAKIVSIPVEEVLEVVEAVIEDITPKYQTVSNIEFLTVTTSSEGVTAGTLTDYDGNVYYYAWDEKPKRIMRLSGEQVNKLTWDLCNSEIGRAHV